MAQFYLNANLKLSSDELQKLCDIQPQSLKRGRLVCQLGSGCQGLFGSRVWV